MAEGFTPAEDFTPDEAENIEMENRDDWDEIQDRYFDPTEVETPFVDNLPDTPGYPESLEKQEKIESFYKFFENSGYKVDRNAPIEYKASFKMNADKELAITYKGKTYRLTRVKNPNKFLSLSTLKIMYGKGGTQFIRNVLGIKVDTIIMPPVLSKELHKINKTIAATKSSPERPESIEMQTVKQVEESLNTFLETSTQTELALGPSGSLPFRELAGLDRSLRNMLF